MREFLIEWTDEALQDDVGGWPIIRDVASVVLNPETGLMEMTEPEADPLAHQARRGQSEVRVSR